MGSGGGIAPEPPLERPRMTTQVPPGPENAVAPQDPPPFTMGHAQYPPASAAQGYPAVSYPQQGATGYPAPAPYPQPGASMQAGAGYSTAPPWVAAQSAPAPGAPPAPAGPGAPPEQPIAPYGGLLVQFPDKMQHASRAQAPAVWPVAAFTLLFGVPGAISAVRRAGQARRTRNSTAPYWIAFLASLVAGGFFSFVMCAVVIGPMVTEIRENNRLEAVQRNVAGDGQLKNARIDVTAAQCRAVTKRDAEGLREYLCRLTLVDGRTASLTLTADESGQWRSAPSR